MREILVLGGTGAIGGHLVETLAKMGFHVTVTSRTDRNSSTGVQYIRGNAQLDSFLALLLERKWDAIVDFMNYSTPIFRRRATKLLTATNHYIFLSSSRVYAETRGKIKEDSPRLLDISEDQTFLATDEYSLAKARQENVLLESGFINWTIIRPYITYGHNRLQLGVLEKEAWLYRALEGRAIVFSEGMACKLTTMTFGLDVARVMALLIGRQQAHGESYNITQAKSASWGEILDIYLRVLERHLGKRPKVVLLDNERFSRCHPAAYQIDYDRLFDREFDIGKITDFAASTGLEFNERNLATCLEEFLNQPLFLPIDWRGEANKDRYAGNFTHLREIPTRSERREYMNHRFMRGSGR